MHKDKSTEVGNTPAKKRRVFQTTETKSQKGENEFQKTEAENKTKANPAVGSESVDNKHTYGDTDSDQSTVSKHSGCDCCGDCDCDHTTCDCNPEGSNVIQYTCRICGKNYNDLEGVMACEQECLKQQKENQAKKAFEEKNKSLLSKIDDLKCNKQKMINFLETLDKEIDEVKEELHQIMDSREEIYQEYTKVCRELADAEQELKIKEDQDKFGSSYKKSKTFRKSIVNGRAVYEVDGKEVDRHTYEDAIRNYRIKTSGPYWWEF